MSEHSNLASFSFNEEKDKQSRVLFQRIGVKAVNISWGVVSVNATVRIG